MSDPDLQQRLRELPAVKELLDHPDLQAPIAELGAALVKEVVRSVIDERRAALLAGDTQSATIDIQDVVTRARREAAPSLIPVINATGVVVHTNLGRSPLPRAVAERALELASGYCNIEYDLDGGGRGHRHGHAARVVARATGAEAALVVNNCAAAVLLALAGLAHGKEVIVSRGELVEIGGAFRVPDVMRASGADLVEVGTTNRTHIADYSGAITDRTGLLLKVHRSNFAVVGFTAEVGSGELAELGKKTGVPTMYDLGSGLMARPADSAFAHEPEVAEVIGAGIDLVTFSGDKLLGGPQAGILAGTDALIKVLAKVPMLRALRTDKFTLGAVEATLDLHAAGRAEAEVPTVRMLHEDVAAVAKRRDALLAAMGEPAPAGLTLTAVDTLSKPGGGSLPLAELASAGLTVGLQGASAAKLHHRLRESRPPVIGRVEDDRLLLDLRTVLPDQLPALAAALKALAPAPKTP